jgi:hypothetical protein
MCVCECSSSLFALWFRFGLGLCVWMLFWGLGLEVVLLPVPVIIKMQDKYVHVCVHGLGFRV